jgi:hypothetical protein
MSAALSRESDMLRVDWFDADVILSSYCQVRSRYR